MHCGLLSSRVAWAQRLGGMPRTPVPRAPSYAVSHDQAIWRKPPQDVAEWQLKQ